MITPIIIYNDKILKRLSIFINIGGITIYPFIILKEKNKKQGVNKLVVHESIHIKQAEELLVLPFYILYVLEWLVKSLIYKSFKKGYYNISFEREAYSNQYNKEYISKRNKYQWIKRIIK
jgi:hypothetical protein